MWFWTAGPVVCIPMILTELTEFPRKNCGNFFKKHNLDEQVQLLDVHRRFFFGLHLAVGRHHHHWTPRCPHGLQLSRAKVFRTDHMHTRSWVNYKKFFPLDLLLTQPGVPIPPRESRMQPCHFLWACRCFFCKIPSLASGTSLLSFSLFMGHVLKFHSAGTSLMKNFDIYFSQRWSFLFPDTRMTLRRLSESYSFELMPRLSASGFPETFYLEKRVYLNLVIHNPIVIHFSQ